MRFARYRDQVLWPIAYKIGLDPTTNFEDSQARAIGDYINMYVRKLWASQDWPEWEFVSNFVPGAGKSVQDHIVSLNNDGGVGNLNVAKVLNVYLNDPSKYALPLEIPFEMRQNGVYVGLDHGNQVWIRYLSQPPIYTAEVWNASRTYAQGEVAYSSNTGECYISLINGNQGNDPAVVPNPGGGGNPPPSPTQVQKFVPGSPGFDGQDGILYAQYARADGVPINDPPESGSKFNIAVRDSTGATIASTTHTATGTESLATIMAAMHTAIAVDPDLATYTITEDPVNLILSFEDASLFSLKATVQPTGGGATYRLVTGQTQSYIPPDPGTDLTPQQTKITLTNANVLPGTIFQFTFIDTAGIKHVASYSVLSTDDPSSILSGVIAAIQAQSSTDEVFAQISVILDGTNGSAVFIAPFPGAVGFDWFYTPPPDPEPPAPGTKGTWWALQPFPYELVDPVIAGANAEVLQEWGQIQSGMAAAQLVAPEVQLRTTVSGKQDTNDMRPRGAGRSRYAMK